MKPTGVLVLAFLLFAATVKAGEIYGTVTDGGKPVAAGVKVEIKVAGKVYAGETDKFGSYRVIVKEKGKGVLTVHVNGQSPSLGLFSYDKSTRYDYVLEMKDSTLSIRRK